ncbi:MAG: DNA polymerase III subunit delta [Nitrolancea sp.]
MITILHGSDRLTIDERVAAIRADVDPSGISTTVIDNAASDLGAVRSSCGALGFFGSGRFVVARDLLTSSKRRGRKSSSDDDGDSAVSVLGGVPRETTLLVVEPSLDPRMEHDIRKVVPDLQVERYDVPRGQRLVEWACQRARRHQAVCGQNEARQLLEALFPGSWPAESRRDDVPPDLFRLDSEIAKLATAAGEDGNISSVSIARLVPGAEAEDFWGITNAIMDGNVGKAVVETERAYSLGSAPEAILGQITSQFEALAVASLAGRDVSLSELATASGLSEGRLRQTSRYAHAFPNDRIASALDALRELDIAAKSGTAEIGDALVPLIASLADGTSAARPR